MNFMSAEPGDIRAVVLEEFAESNALLGIVKFTLRPVRDGVPVDTGHTHARISLGDEGLGGEFAELDDQATDLLINILMKDGQRLRSGGGRAGIPLRFIQKTWNSLLLLIRGGLGGGRRNALSESEAEWHSFEREVTHYMRRQGPVDGSQDAGGEDV